MTRCFIAIDIDDGLRSQLRQVQRDLAKIAGSPLRGVKWVRPENIHLTLKFLGEITDPDVLDVCRIMESVAGKLRAFEVDVRSLGCFANPARVIWAGVEHCPRLDELHGLLDASLAEAGFKPDTRGYKGHLTLCRIKNSASGRKLADALDQVSQNRFLSIVIDSVCLYKSELTKAGPYYTLMSRCQLGD